MAENELGGTGEGSLIAIVAAMDEEVAPLRARLGNRRELAVPSGRAWLGRLGGAEVVLAVTGDGERNARRGLEALLARRTVGRVLVVGVAGGLSAELGVGALLVADHVVDEIGGGVRAADAALAALTARACGARRGVVVSAGRIADTADERRRLLALATTPETAGSPLAAAPPAVAVDLESAAFAAVAAGAGIPWIVLRAISDTAGESVPALLNQSRDEGGAVRRGRVAVGLLKGLLTDPLKDLGTLGRLLELRKRVERCALGLAGAVELAVKGVEGLASVDSGFDPENTVSPEGNRNGARAIASRRHEP
jgi:nucleoside phosphorylase